MPNFGGPGGAQEQPPGRGWTRGGKQLFTLQEAIQMRGQPHGPHQAVYHMTCAECVKHGVMCVLCRREGRIWQQRTDAMMRLHLQSRGRQRQRARA